jgi:hypothetical protein
MEAEPLRSTLLQSKSFPKTFWFLLPYNSEAKLPLRGKFILTYYTIFHIKLLSEHCVILCYNFNLKTAIKCLTLLKSTECDLYITVTIIVIRLKCS